jgi:hypothetical protein
MNNYHESKKARRVAAIAYLLFMTFIVGGTLLSQQNTPQSKANESQAFSSTHSEKTI